MYQRERERETREAEEEQKEKGRERERWSPKQHAGDQEMNTGTLFPYHHIHLPVLDVHGDPVSLVLVYLIL